MVQVVGGAVGEGQGLVEVSWVLSGCMEREGGRGGVGYSSEAEVGRGRSEKDVVKRDKVVKGEGRRRGQIRSSFRAQ